MGVAREESHGVIQSDYTQMTCVRDPQSLKFYFKTYEDQSIKFVDLAKFDLNAPTIKKAAITGIQTAQDISGKLTGY